MQKTSTSKWIGDAVMLVIFLLAFFLDLTGVELHQWVGAAAAALAGWHLITRWGWVSAVTQRFFGKTTHQARLYLLIDALLLGGFGLITLTGLVISTWLSLSLGYYQVWLAAHILVSIGTLALLVVKLALHGRWIAATTRKIFAPLPEPAPVPAATPAAAAAVVRERQAMSRRDFLKVMSLVGGASFIALASAGSGLASLLAAAGETSGSTTASVDLAGAASAASSASASQSAGGASASSQSSSSAAGSSSSAPGSSSSSASQSSDSAASSSSLTCQGRCPRNEHCAYPGRCRRYTDSSGNGLCDLGECA